jgi:hypothetical protein
MVACDFVMGQVSFSLLDRSLSIQFLELPYLPGLAMIRDWQSFETCEVESSFHSSDLVGLRLFKHFPPCVDRAHLVL